MQALSMSCTLSCSHTNVGRTGPDRGVASADTAVSAAAGVAGCARAHGGSVP